MNKTENTSTDKIKVIRGRVDSLSLYEITENELETLEKGSPSSTYLNFAIFLLSVGFSFLVSLLTVEIKSMRTYSAFMIFTVIGILAGVILLVLWHRERRFISDVIKKIKGRIPNT